MIGKLTGTVDVVGPETAIIDVGGVGYLVQCATPTLVKLVPGQPASLHIETFLREDQLRLFGFATSAELAWFRLLQKVQGVGASVALSILAALAPGDIAAAIAAGDHKTLSRAKGVGPRVAQRVASELKGKVPEGLLVGVGAGPAAEAMPPEAADAVSALENLGYTLVQSRQAVSAALKEAPDADTQRLVRGALKAISGR